MTTEGEIASTTEVKQKQRKEHRGHDITTKTIKAPQFAYAWLELITESPPTQVSIPLDALSVRSYISSALTRFLGLTGSAIFVDILKVEENHCWVRVTREDLSPLIAAAGGWTGNLAENSKVGLKVKASGNWLSILSAEEGASHIWNQ